MTETLFAFDERNYQQCQQAFRGSNNQEYYRGDYTIDAGSVIDVRAEKAAVGSCSIIRLHSRSRLFFRRSWSHIREDATDVTVLWFVKRGAIRLTHQGGMSTARAGDFLVTKSMSPFTMECQPDTASRHQVLHVIVPTHLFRNFFPGEVVPGFSVPAKTREFQLPEHLFAEVLEDEGELSDSARQLLVDSALTVLAEALQHCENSTQVRQSLPEKRWQDALRFIEVHLSDPRLSAAMVAEACGISSRYLSHLLKSNGTSFLDLVRDKRLEVASRWLASTRAGDISIAEVAFRVGFKSPAHFSRLFKRVFKKGPRDYRAMAARQPYLSAGHSTTLQ